MSLNKVSQPYFVALQRVVCPLMSELTMLGPEIGFGKPYMKLV